MPEEEKIKILEKIIEQNEIRESSRIARLENKNQDLINKLTLLKIELAIIQRQQKQTQTCQIS